MSWGSRDYYSSMLNCLPNKDMKINHKISFQEVIESILCAMHLWSLYLVRCGC